jgi:hypothetical protein
LRPLFGKTLPEFSSMLECIFTIDYEIYGNGTGSLSELVLEPARRLKKLFDQAGAKLVVFVEVAELKKIDEFRTDPSIAAIKDQIREFYEQGFEIGLHLHPQWWNARFREGKWDLDYTEYNLCTLPEERIEQIIAGSIDFLREVLHDPAFVPASFRAGNWLFQPTEKAARVLAKHGIKIDSSVFKGGRQLKHGLDYRGTRNNGDCWRFRQDVTRPQPDGPLLEVPTYTRMVPFWKMLTRKRVQLQKKGASTKRNLADQLYRIGDLIRPFHPLKFDFCRMSLDELRETIEHAGYEDENNPGNLKPLVAIGHTKDLVDFSTVSAFLSYLNERGVPIRLLQDFPVRRTTGAAILSSKPVEAGQGNLVREVT